MCQVHPQSGNGYIKLFIPTGHLFPLLFLQAPVQMYTDPVHMNYSSQNKK